MVLTIRRTKWTNIVIARKTRLFKTVLQASAVLVCRIRTNWATEPPADETDQSSRSSSRTVTTSCTSFVCTLQSPSCFLLKTWVKYNSRYVYRLRRREELWYIYILFYLLLLLFFFFLKILIVGCETIFESSQIAAVTGKRIKFIPKWHLSHEVGTTRIRDGNLR